MSSLQLFSYGDHQVRTFDIDGTTSFLASDVCNILGYSNASDAISTHVDPEDVSRPTLAIREGSREVARTRALINESGVYALTFGSKLAEARKFKRWVTSEVLPAIRKTGSYGSSRPAELTRSDLARMVLESESEKLALSSKLEAIQPKADYVDTFVADEDLITFRTLASDLEIGERDLRDALIYSGWIYSQTKSRWSNSKEKLIPVTRYSAMADKKQYFQAVLNHDVPRFGGEVMHTLKVTAPGASAIARLLIRLANQYGSFEESILPLETRYNEKKAS